MKQTQISNKKTKNFLGINFKRTKTPDPSGRVSTRPHPHNPNIPFPPLLDDVKDKALTSILRDSSA